jgi:hypothetical protein
MSGARNGPGASATDTEADPGVAGRPDPAKTTCANLATSDNSDIVRRLRRRRQIEAIHRVDPRVVGELLDEIAHHRPKIGGDIDQRLARYAALDPVAVTCSGRAVIVT